MKKAIQQDTLEALVSDAALRECRAVRVEGGWSLQGRSTACGRNVLIFLYLGMTPDLDARGCASACLTGFSEGLDDGLQAWTDCWSLVSGVLICVQCGAWRQPSEAERPFVHAMNCTLRRDFVQWPWQGLLEIIGKLPAVPGAAGLEPLGDA